LKDKRKLEGAGIGNSPIFNIRQLTHSETNNDRFHYKRILSSFQIEHNFNDYLDIFKVETEIDGIFQLFFEEYTQEAGNDDVISMTVKHEFLDTPIYIHAKKKNWSCEDFLNKIFQVSQSNTQFIMNGKLDIELIIVKKIDGSGKRKAPQSVGDYRRNKRSLVVIQNLDRSCGL